jgi:hypothetical protein
VFLANAHRSPGSGKAKDTIAISGVQCCEIIKHSGLDKAALMHPQICDEMILEQFDPIWNRKFRQTFKAGL